MKRDCSECRRMLNVLAALGVITFGPVGAVGDSYIVTVVPTLGGPSNSATAVNTLGQVVGASSLDFDLGGDNHGYVWDSGTGALTDIETLGGSNSVGYDINAAGQVVGYSYTATVLQRAFLWESGVMTDILAAGPSASWAVNDSGLVVGHLGSRAFVWDGATTDPGSIGSPIRAYGVNSSGQMAGESGLRAFFWEDDGDPDTSNMRDLGTLPGGRPRARARGINDAGQVVGEANFGSSDGEDYHAVLWENLSWDAAGSYTGDIADLGQLPGGRRSFGYAVNDSGRVVGYATSVGIGASHAFVYDAVRTLRDLNDLIPAASGWTLRFAMDINESGQIVGYGWLDGQQRGFLLTPLYGDIDGDWDVDLADLDTFAGCLAGAGVTTPPLGCGQTDFLSSDMDADVDADLADFAWFQTSFTGEPPTSYDISGSIQLMDAGPLAGVTLSAVGPVNDSTTTDGNGDYRFIPLPEGGYTITPSDPTHYFYPFDASVDLLGADVTGVDFDAHVMPTGVPDGETQGTVFAVDPPNYSITIQGETGVVTVYVYAGTLYGGVASSFEEITVGMMIQATYFSSTNLADQIDTEP